MKKPRRPIKPFKGATWNANKKRWEGMPPIKLKQKKAANTIRKILKKHGIQTNPYIGKLKWIPIQTNTLLSKLTPAKFQKCAQILGVPKKKISSVSEKRKQALKIYAVLKKEWAKKHRHCIPCLHEGRHTKAESYPHHMRGRGNLLNEVRWWLAVCKTHHQLIENNRAWAKQKGYLLSRDSKAIRVEEGKK